MMLLCDSKLSAVIVKMVKSAGSERIKTTINLNQKWSESLVPHSCVHTACRMNESLILGTAFVVRGKKPRQTETTFRTGLPSMKGENSVTCSELCLYSKSAKYDGQ